MPQKSKKAPQKVEAPKPEKRAQAKKVEDAEDITSDEFEQESSAQIKSNPKKVGRPQKKEESEEITSEETEEEEHTTKSRGKPRKMTLIKPKQQPRKEKEAEDITSEESEEEPPAKSSSNSKKNVKPPSKNEKQQPKMTEESSIYEEDEDTEEEKANASKKRGNTSKKNQEDKNGEPLAKKVKSGTLLNRTHSDLDSLDFSNSKTTRDGRPWNFKISSWNVDGLRAWVKKNGLDYIQHEKPDILCLQETKCSEAKLPPEVKVSGYHTYWLSGEKEGYSGVALYSKEKPMNVKYGIGNKEHDSEGRLITAEYNKFFLVTTYVPNAGRGLVTLPKRMKWDPALRSYLKKLDAKKPVIVCGDMNVSHNAIDLANPKANTKSAGFTQEERDGFSDLLNEGFVDTFRHLYQEKMGAYTFWTYMGNARSRNVGWRLDYFLLSDRLLPNLCDNVIRNEVYGSDHCPITLLMHV